MTTKSELIQRRDQLLAEANQSGAWNPQRYEEIQDLIKRIDLVADGPDPEQIELDLKPKVKPKKAR
ncbi:hypothetical protein ACCS91_33665 [Rhizobium ruizarguesonis]